MTTLYEKRGRRYFPVRDANTYDGLSNGAWLVVVDNGRTSIRRLLDPAHAELEAAARTARQAMIMAMQEAASPVLNMERYRDRERAQRAWDAWCEIMGDDVAIYSQSCSISDCVDAGIATLTEKARRKQ